jgi:sarcosine oxidase subunit gamma
VADATDRAWAFTQLVASGAPSPEALVVAECRGRALVTVGGAGPAFAAAARGALGVEPPRTPGTVASAGDVAILALGPTEWLVVDPGRDGWAFERELAAALAAAGGSAVDVSHGRAVLRLSGPSVRDVLARGCPIDLHPRGFTAGSCAQTLFGKINVLLHARADRDAIELYVGRSYADALADGLMAAAREVGVVLASPVG